jgi:sodium-dependent phosphate cotransporter
VLLLVVLLYVFFLSISLMGASFKFFGRGFAEQLLATTANPFLGLFIGILATSMVQSSSTVTAMTVGLVAGGALDIQGAIPIILGSNVGTSVTNTLVSVGHLSRPDEFRRAFAAATVHDFFNLILVAVFFPLQLFTNVLGHTSSVLTGGLKDLGGLQLVNPIKTIVGPAVQVIGRATSESGAVMLFIAVALLFLSLRYLVVVLKSLVIGRIEGFFNQMLFKTAPRALILGVLLTIAVQSSSITTSLVIPLAGAGILSLRQIFPFTLGANIGTTITAILASLVTGNPAAVTVALAHLLVNLLGVGLVWPIRSVPLAMAEMLAEWSLKSRLVPPVYVGTTFFLVPLALINFAR